MKRTAGRHDTDAGPRRFAIYQPVTVATGSRRLGYRGLPRGTRWCSKWLSDQLFDWSFFSTQLYAVARAALPLGSPLFSLSKTPSTRLRWIFFCRYYHDLERILEFCAHLGSHGKGHQRVLTCDVNYKYYTTDKLIHDLFPPYTLIGNLSDVTERYYREANLVTLIYFNWFDFNSFPLCVEMVR